MSTKYIASNWRLPNKAGVDSYLNDNYGLTFGNFKFIDISSLDSNILNSSFSISIWFKKEEGGVDNDRLIDLTIDSNTSLQIITDEATDKFAVNFILSGVSKINQQTFNSYTSTFNEWNQIVLTWDGTSYVYYFNGQPIASTGSTSIGISGTGFFIGKRADANFTTFFNGSISEVAVFDYALSATQISTLYGSSSLGAGNPMVLNPVAFYPLGDNSSGNPLTQPNEAVEDASVFDFVPNDSIDGNISNPSTFANLTVSCWVNVDSFASLQNGILSSSTSSGANDYQYGFALEVRNDNKFRFKIGGGGSTTNWLVTHQIQGNGII